MLVRLHIQLATLAGIVATVPVLQAASSYLPLRQESGACIYDGITENTIENTFGSKLAVMTFSDSTTYDFYSPPLASATTLTTTDKAGGTIFMKNTSSSHANDFAVTGRMRFYDYNPISGSELLIVDTGDSSVKSVNAGQTVNWAIPNVQLSAKRTVPAGHLLHIAVTISRVSGNPAGFGQLLYNGAKNNSTTALFSQNYDQVFWNFAPVGSGRLSISRLPDGSQRLISVAAPYQTYSVVATTNLASPVWTVIGSATANCSGSFSFTDKNAGNYSCRFYRLVTSTGGCQSP